MKKNTFKKINFGEEIASMLPALLREVTSQPKGANNVHGMTVSQVVVLDALREKGSCRSTELAGILNLTASAVTAISDKMVKSGLIRRHRSAGDRRVVLISLRKKGMDLAMEVQKWRKSVTNELFSILTPEEKKQYLLLLQKVYKNLESKNDTKYNI